MKAIVYDGPRDFSLREVPTPVPGPGEVLLRSTVTGVCGTDLHIHEGGFFAAYPLTPGHEIVGTVEACGPGVAGLTPGSQVAADNASACGVCDACGRDTPLFCRRFRSLGVNAPGGFAEFVLVRADKCFPVDDLDPETAVLAEPTACAVHGMDVLALRPGANVALVGAGPTGLILAQLIARGGASRITVAATSPAKLEVAASLGIDRTLLVDRGDPAGTVEQLRALSPRGYDVVVDATGAAALQERLLPLVADNGTLFLYGMADETDTAAWHPYDIFRRQLTIKGSFAQVNCFERAVEMLRSGRVQARGIVTTRFGLDRYAEALSGLGGRDRIKTVIAH